MPTDALSAPLPVHLLTGFLGSGKTALLGSLMRGAGFADTVVIVNEFGDVGIDHVLLGQAGANGIVMLDAGCLCCAGIDSLRATLASLHERRLHGDVPPFARVVVEAAGLAEPAALIDALAADTGAAGPFRLAGIVATVDARHGAATLDEYQAAALQVAAADLIVITKTDTVTADAVAALAERLRRQAPRAALLRADRRGLGERATFFQEGDRRGAVPGAVPGMPSALSAALTRFSHVLRHGIAAHVIRALGPVDDARYANWVACAQARLGERLLRVKGVLRMEDGAHYAIHGVRGEFEPPQRLGRGIPEASSGVLSLVTRHADAAELAACAAALEDPGHAS